MEQEIRSRKLNMKVSEAVTQRQAIRAFKPDPVPEDVVKKILELARFSPSGGNLQPWHVYALAGEPLATFKNIIVEKVRKGIAGETPEYAVYPSKLWEPFRTRRREAGTLRYAALGFDDKDQSGLTELTLKNVDFFGAPIGLFFCLDRRVGPPQWSDMGMYMQTVMLLATERGLDTCPQEFWASWPKTVGDYLGLPEDQMLFAGMSMGYRSPDHPLNTYRAPRDPLESFAKLRGFDMS
jgi:nitroreductase